VILLKIGYRSFAFKNDKEAFGVMTAMSKSIEVDDRRYDKKALVIQKEQPELKMETLPAKTKFIAEESEEEISAGDIRRLNPPTLRLT
jgi:hypothetical protein